MRRLGENMKTFFKWVGIVLGSLVALLAFMLVVMPPLTRPFTNAWGATAAEVAEELPGDSLVPEPDQVSTRAVTIDAPPELVFALLKQMGYGRGGWYAWDWFYQATGSADFVDGHHSRRIDPELQKFRQGDSIAIFPGATLDAEILDPGKTLVLYKVTDGENKLVPPHGPKPPIYSDLEWGWIVKPAQTGGSRLILRTRASGEGQGAFAEWVNDKPLEMFGAAFAYKTLAGIRSTAEKLSEAGVVVNEAGTQVAGPAFGLDKETSE